MYIFEEYPIEDIEGGWVYGIREFDGILGEDKIIASGTDENKLKRVFRNLKRGGGFETMTPEFFKPVNFFVDKK